MKQILTVFGFTFRDAVKKKAFIISTVIIMVLLLIITSLPRIIEAFSDDENIDDEYEGYTCYFIDENNLIEKGLDTLITALPGADIFPGEADKLDEYKGYVLDDKKTTVVNVIKKDELPFIKVMTKDFMSGLPGDYVAEVLSQTYAINTLYELGLDDNAIAISQTELQFEYELAGDMNISGYTVGILLTMLIFFAIYYYGYGVAMSVATEKTTRVMETLVVSAKPSRILIGKCLAMGVVGLIQFSGIIAFTALCVKILIPDDFMIMGMPLSFSAFTTKTALLIILYFILGYTLYAVLNSVCGATVSKIEDLNSAMMPVMLIALASFYLGYMSAVTGVEGVLQKVSMLLPFSSPFIVPFKLLNGSVATVDIILSILLLVIFIVVITYVSIRIYSASVLHYGKRQKLPELFKTKM